MQQTGTPGRDVTDKNAGKDKEISLQQQQMEGKRIPPYETFDEKNRSLLDNMGIVEHLPPVSSSLAECFLHP